MGERKEEIKEAAELYAWKQYKDPLLKKRDIATFIAGAEYALTEQQNPWRSIAKDGDPKKDMLALVLMDCIYYVCEYLHKENEWWVCDGYIAGYSPQGKPLYSAKTKLCTGDVERITRYMEIANEPKDE